jgi:hypothetical protein
MPFAATLRRTRLALSIGAGALLLGAAACPKDDPTSSNEDISGSYSLASVSQGGSSCTVTASGCTIEGTGEDVIVVTDGSLNLAPNGAGFTVSASGTKNGAAYATQTVAGTWSKAGSGVNFTVPGIPLPIGATYANETITVSMPGQIFSSSQAAVAVVFTKD